MDFFEFIEPVAPIFVSSATEAIKDAGDSGSTIRGYLGNRDDFGFVADVEQLLVESGMTEEEAAAVTVPLILAPSIQLNSKVGCVQGIIVTAVEGSERLEFPTRIFVKAVLSAEGRTRRISDIQLEVRMVDLEDTQDVNSLAIELAELAHEYPTPRPSSRSFGCIVLGKPQGALAEEGPSWRDLMIGLEPVFGVEVTILTDQGRVKSPLPASAEVVVALDPSFVGVAIQVGKSPVPPIIETHGKSSREIVHQVVAHVREKRLEKDNAQPATKMRALERGETVFHRKIGTSSAFDRFGEPCKPCNHGVDKFKRYYAAPKAEKGMARLYTNFESSMLYHCGRDYGCGMYAVFAPAKLMD